MSFNPSGITTTRRDEDRALIGVINLEGITIQSGSIGFFDKADVRSGMAILAMSAMDAMKINSLKRLKAIGDAVYAADIDGQLILSDVPICDKVPKVITTSVLAAAESSQKPETKPEAEESVNSGTPTQPTSQTFVFESGSQFFNTGSINLQLPADVTVEVAEAYGRSIGVALSRQTSTAAMRARSRSPPRTSRPIYRQRDDGHDDSGEGDQLARTYHPNNA